MQTPKACFFDVFGTLVDWRSSIAREAEAILKPLGHSLDWLAFADAWRDEYQPAMEEIRSGRLAFCKLDVLHRRNLEKILPRFKISGLSEDTMRHLNLAWHRLDAWPDSAAGLARLKKQVPDRAGVERQHLADGRSRPPQQFSLGRDPRLRDRRRLQAEAAGLSRGLRGVRSAARRLHDGGGAFQRSEPRRARAGFAPGTSRGRTSTAPARASRSRPCRSMCSAPTSKTWPASSASSREPLSVRVNSDTGKSATGCRPVGGGRKSTGGLDPASTTLR